MGAGKFSQASMSEQGSKAGSRRPSKDSGAGSAASGSRRPSQDAVTYFNVMMTDWFILFLEMQAPMASWGFHIAEHINIAGCIDFNESCRLR